MDRYNGHINDWITNTVENDDYEDDIRASEMFALSVQGVALQQRTNFIPPQPCHTSVQTGWRWIHELLDGHPSRIYDAFRMSKECFMSFCQILHNNYGLTNEPNEINYIESVAIFLFILAQGVSNRQAQERFQHSGSTISKHLHKVLDASSHLARDIIIPTYDGAVPECIRRSQMYYPYFKDCIGALDGTHVHACVAKNPIAFIGRKGTTTQNILGVCDFDMCFTFISAGWEGSMHDARILKEVLNNRRLNFPTPPEGKYYLVDAGYANKRGFLAPYKGGVRYHQADFRRGDGPRNAGEKFNKVHSSLRSIIERTFGVWKSRWKLLQNMPSYDIKLQIKLVGVSMAVHNFIRRHDREDQFFRDFISSRGGSSNVNDEDDNDESDNDEDDNEESSTTQMHDVTYMNDMRDQIRDQIDAMNSNNI